MPNCQCGGQAKSHGSNRGGTKRYKCISCNKTFTLETGRPIGRPYLFDRPMTSAERVARSRELKKGRYNGE